MRVLILSILLAFAGSSFGQEPVISLNIVTKDEDSGKKLAGATVVVKQGSSVFVTKQSASNGKVPPIDLPLGQNYTVIIKKDGYVSKVATIDGHFDYPEDLPPFVNFPIQTALFKKVDGVDFSFLENTPMIKFELDQYGMQTWDQGYTNDMLDKIKKLKKEMANKAAEDEQKRKEFDQYVAAGDKAMGKPDFQTAIDNYEKAITIFDEAEVKTKLEDAKKKLKEQQDAAQNEQKFQDLMSKAKNEYSAKNLEEALKLYKEASGVKPDEQLPKDRIAAIEKELKEQADQQAKFDKFVADGDASMTSEDFDNAITNYEGALGIKEDAGVKAKLEDAKKKKADKEAADKAAEELEANYQKLIDEADKLFDSKTYVDSKSKYEEALKLKSNESHPASRISEIEDILKKLQADKDAAEKLEKDYQAAIDAGDAAMGSSDWDGAIAKYEEALKLKPDEGYPKDQIKKANDNKANDAAAKELNEKYDKLLAEAKTAKDGEKYEDAITKLDEASALKPDEQFPKDEIAAIKKLMADMADAQAKEEQYTKLMQEGNDEQGKENLEAALAKYQEAIAVKPGDAEAQKKIDEVNKLIADKKDAADQEAKFNELVASGDQEFGNKSYENAKSKYQEALGIKDDQGVKDKIAEIDKLMKDQADEAALEEKYQAALKEADDAYAAKNWEDALSKYENALSIKDDAYPKGKIEEVKKKIQELADADAKDKQFNDLVAEGDRLGGSKEYEAAIAKYEEAIKIKPDPAVSQKIVDLKEQKKADEANKELIEKYKAKLKEADDAFDAKKWDGARAFYQDAIDIKEDEQYPKDQLDEIERRMKAEAEDEVEAQYQKIIDKANGLRDEEKFEDAIGYYERAQSIKSSDPFPQEQINKIKEIIKQREQELADKEAFEKKYKDLLAAADADLSAKSYQDALSKYTEASNMKTDDQYPKDKIKEIEDLLSQLDADAALDAKYKAAIDVADKLFDDSKWTEAKSAYQDALDIKSNEQYPKDRIGECDKKMQEESVDEEEEQYQKILTAAKKKFDEKDYQKAIDYYERATSIRPNDQFPKDEIAKIKKLIADMDADAALDAKYKAAIDKADKLFDAESYSEAKTAYQDALDIKDEQYPKDRILACDDKMKAQSDDEAQQAYQKILDVAQKNFDDKNYKKALSLYKRANTLRPDDKLPQDRIDEINQILRDMDDMAQKELEYKKILNEADNLFESSKWQKAKQRYYDALDVISTKQYPKDQIEKCNEKIKSTGDTANKQYDKLIKKADEYFDAENWEKSKGLYKRALNIKPSDQYPKDRLKEIDRILNPPPVITGVDPNLIDRGDPINEDPIDIEAMLLEAKEQAEYQETKNAFKQGEDANKANMERYTLAEDVTFETKEAADQIEVDIDGVQWAGEEARKETRDKVDIWSLSVEDKSREYVTVQENDVMYQNRKVEAMQLDIEDNKMDNDKPREQYLLDVEVIKIADEQFDRDNLSDQVDENQKTKSEVNQMIDEQIVSQGNADVARKNTEVKVEDHQVTIINADNANVWDQEDEVMKTKGETELLKDDIIANNLDNDNDRKDNEVIVEKINTDYEKRDKKNYDSQYDQVVNTKEDAETMEIKIEEHHMDNDQPRQEYEKDVEVQLVGVEQRDKKNAEGQYDLNVDTQKKAENMEIKIEENQMDNDQPRQDYEDKVETQQFQVNERDKQNLSNQVDENQDTQKKAETMEIKIDDKNTEMNQKRQGYEKEVQKIDQDITDYNEDLTKENAEQGLDAKDYTEGMNDTREKFEKKMDDNSDKEYDKTVDALEEHNEHLNDDSNDNQKAMEKGEDYIESLKDIDVNNITPELENELGKKYPEGVTEESFQINDNNGLMKSYVVRRVVVTNGNGKVYEQVRTRYGGVSYTRNGQPISEFQWSDETSGMTRN